MDHLNESMAATSIDNCEGASAAANGTDATAIEPDLLMAVTKRKHNVNEDSESDDDTEDVVSEDKEGNVIKADRERKLGRRAFKKDDYNKAGTHFQKAINLNPNEIANHYHLAKTMCEQKKYEECVEICSNAIKVGKKNKGSVKLVAASMVLKGQAMKEQEDMDGAFAHVEKAYQFLSSIAHVKLEKGKYFEAFDFIYEAFKCYKMFVPTNGETPSKVKHRANRRITLVRKIFVAHLDDTIEWSKENVKDNEDFIKDKHLADNAFRKNDYELAAAIYTQIAQRYHSETLNFLIKNCKEAEENEKWSLCSDICLHTRRFLDSLLAASKNKKLKKKWKEALSLVRSLEAKAQRRRNNFSEAFDKMFLEILKTHKVSRHHLDLFHVKRADDFVNPDIKLHPNIDDVQWSLFRGMADFWGRGKVTAKELDVFCLCLFMDE